MAIEENSAPRAKDAGQEGGLRTILRLIALVWPSDRLDLKARVVMAFISLLLAKLVSSVVPFIYKEAVDGLDSVDGLIVVPVTLILAYGVARISTVAFAEIRDAFAAKVMQYAVRKVALRTFDHLHRLSLRFHLDRRTGGLSRVIERGTKAIETIIRFSLFITIPTIFEIAFVSAVLAIYLGAIYAAILVVTVVVFYAFTAWVTEWRVEIRRQMNEADTESYTKVVDSLLNYETVKYFGNERHESHRFDKSVAVYEKAAIKTSVSLSVLNTGQVVIFTLGMTLAMFLAGLSVADGTISLGDFVMVNSYFIQVYMPLNFLGTVHREIKQGLVDLESLFGLLGRKVEIVDVPGAPDLVVEKGEIRFQNVDFHYDDTRQILHGVDFVVPGGRTLAVVGASGAGKSTLSRLMYRFYGATKGKILVDGQDVTKVTQSSLRAAIGMVPQDTVLFNDTIGYNIAYGRIGSSHEEIEKAARMAQIHEFITSLPDGYDTHVGERGLKLSGGEKQRVAIARTILKGPPILILDEATSALDSFTEAEIQSALKAVSRGRTTLVIAHRLSTIIDADEIVVLDKGRIVERGDHNQLLALGGHYADLWRRQREAAAAEQRLREAEDTPAGNSGEPEKNAEPISVGRELPVTLSSLAQPDPVEKT
ncbi:MAG: ABCB family ABC transporter ATP-binding protein/permease [Alphaproteobacteria bacterium]